MCVASPFNHLVQPIPTPPGPSPQVRWLDPPRPPTPTIFETEVVGALANTHHEMVVFPSKPVVPALKLQAPSRSAGRRRSGQRLGLNLQLLRHFFWAVPVGSWMTSDGFPPAAPGPCSRFPPKKNTTTAPTRLPPRSTSAALDGPSSGSTETVRRADRPAPACLVVVVVVVVAVPWGFVVRSFATRGVAQRQRHHGPGGGGLISGSGGSLRGPSPEPLVGLGPEVLLSCDLSSLMGQWPARAPCLWGGDSKSNKG